VEILFIDITTTGEGAWAPSSGLVPDDIGGTTGVGESVMKMTMLCLKV
jgi:hypothetical protein